MHVNKKFKLWEASVQTWLFDERISGETEWRPILQGKNGDWKQHLLIKSFFAAVMAAPYASRTGRANARARLIGVEATGRPQRHPSLPMGTHVTQAQIAPLSKPEKLISNETLLHASGGATPY